MLRLAFSICCSVVIARWVYHEVQLTAPQLVPYIDYSLERIQIPTHDKWLKTALNNAIDLIETQENQRNQLAARNPAIERRNSPKQAAREAPEEPYGAFSTVAFDRNTAFERF